jgi:hypothetical protein
LAFVRYSSAYGLATCSTSDGDLGMWLVREGYTMVSASTIVAVPVSVSAFAERNGC